jgi:hypothetical protein
VEEIRCENTVEGIQDFLAVAQYSPNKLILTVVGSRPQFPIVLDEFIFSN